MDEKLDEIELRILQVLSEHSPYRLGDVSSAYIKLNRSIDVLRYAISRAQAASLELAQVASIIRS